MADISDVSGTLLYRVWGKSETGSVLPQWTRTAGGIICQVPLPPSSDQVQWLKFTIGAIPEQQGTATPLPLDPTTIIKKHG